MGDPKQTIHSLRAQFRDKGVWIRDFGAVSIDNLDGRVSLAKTEFTPV